MLSLLAFALGNAILGPVFTGHFVPAGFTELLILFIPTLSCLIVGHFIFGGALIVLISAAGLIVNSAGIFVLNLMVGAIVIAAAFISPKAASITRLATALAVMAATAYAIAFICLPMLPKFRADVPIECIYLIAIQTAVYVLSASRLDWAISN